MPAVLVSAEWLVAVGVVVALAFATMIYLRRRAIARGKTLTLCAIRNVDLPRWRLGLLRMGRSDLEWFTLNGLSRRPLHVWARGGLELSPPRPMPTDEPLPMLWGAELVACSYEGFPFALALRPQDYRALRAWLESAPPSFNTDLTIA